jgi:toxin ParE1/3/4
MVRIVWTDLSVSDLKDIVDYISEDSTRYASLMANRIYKKVQILVSNPSLGRIVPEINDNTVRELIEGNYRIIYRIKTENQIDILRVYHSARLFKKSTLPHG